LILPGGADLLGGTNLVRAEIPFGGNAVCTVNPYSYRVDTPAAHSWIAATIEAHGAGR